MITKMDPKTLERVLADPNEPVVLCPFVDGMLRNETRQALLGGFGSAVFYPLHPDDDGAYGRLLDKFWEVPGHLLVVEQDMVPTPGQIVELLACEQPWCQIEYHYGDGRYIASLGFAKFSHDCKTAYPTAAMLASRDAKGVIHRAHWASMSENLAQQLIRWHVMPHIHPGTVTHLHYPEQERG